MIIVIKIITKKYTISVTKQIQQNASKYIHRKLKQIQMYTHTHAHTEHSPI